MRNKYHGFGELILVDGYRYKGDWRNGKKEGAGEESNEEKNYHYKGGFHKNKKNGHGALQDSDIKYEGAFKKGKFHG